MSDAHENWIALPATVLAVSYSGGRAIIDVDAHIMEPRGWLRQYAATDARDSIPELGVDDAAFAELLDHSERAHDERATDSAARDLTASEFMSMPRKGWMSLGGWNAGERSQALDLLGFEKQVIFPTGSFVQVMSSPAKVRPEAARAMNRGLLDFCHDPRLLATSYVPFEFGSHTAVEFVTEAARAGAAGVLIDSIPSPKQKIGRAHV